MLPGADMEYFGSAGERLQMMFNFQVNQALFYALATSDDAAADRGAARRPSPGRRPRSGDSFCAITMSWIWDV